MRYLRAKHIRKALRQYKFLCNIRAPYKILLDGNFIAMCLQMKVDLKDRVPKFLQTSECTFYVPQTAVDELKLLGEEMSEAYRLAKSLNVIKLRQPESTTDEPPAVSQQIMSIIGDSNADNYFVATQETDLRAALREIPGVPLLYLNRSVLVFEDLSRATLRITRKQEIEKNSSLNASEKRKLDSIRRQEGKPSAPTTPHTPKRAKGPNPLSCKKKTKKVVRRKKTK